MDADDIAFGEVLITALGEAGRGDDAVRIIPQVAQMGVAAGRAVQALRILKRMDGVGQLAYITNAVRKLNEEIQAKNRKLAVRNGEVAASPNGEVAAAPNGEVAAAPNGKLGIVNGELPKDWNDMTYEELKKYMRGKAQSRSKIIPMIEIDNELAKTLINAKSTEDLDNIRSEILQGIADQMPRNWGQVFTAWRYTAMLANPRTHIRNIIGNAVFVPAVSLKNIIKIGIESGVIAAGANIERTTNMTSAVAGTGGKYREFAVNDYKTVERELRGGGKYNIDDELRERQNLLPGVLEKVRVLNGWALEAEDAVFLKYHYTRALAGYLSANKVELDDVGDYSSLSNKTLNEARVYAIREAQKATYRDASEIASRLNQFVRDGGSGSKFAKMIVEGVLPYYSVDN